MKTKTLPEHKTIDALSDFFKIFGDPTRIRIIWVLMQSERYVHEISEILEMSPSAVSHQLRILRQGHIVKHRRNGRHILYSLDDSHVEDIFEKGISHIEHI